ncbi:MAG: heparinase II/III family protein [Hyphomicrobiales bacterium]|jgi:uncharacterized heparinase superfamily protein
MAFRPLIGAFKRFGASLTSRWRAMGASLSNLLVGTWSSRRAFFELVPRDMRTADPTRASEWIEGYIALADGIVELKGRKLFSIPAPTEAFATSMHSFEWLHHLRAYDLASTSAKEAQSIAAGHARDHVLDWIATRTKHPRSAHTPLMAARRALALTNQASFLLDEADPHDYRTIMASILADTQFAFTHRAQVEDPTDHCMLVLACCSVAHALREHISVKQQTRDTLTHALKNAFHADGGPRTRRPGDLPPLLATMLSLKALMEARGLNVPQRLLQSIENGQRMLRMVRHPDGTLARFQGTYSIMALETDLIATILFFDTERGPLPILASHTGYARLEAPGSVLLIDCGTPPPPEASHQAHASTLAFEWSYGATKIITNAPEIGYTVDVDLLDQRRTSAHSTLCVGGVSSASFPDGRANSRLIANGLAVDTAKSPDAPTRGFRGRHTGYRQKFGVDHARTLTLSDNGHMVEGHDQLLLPSGALAANNRNPFTLAFQLQPGARVRSEGDRRLRITMRHHTIMFEVEAGTVTVVDPTDRPTYRGPSRARRIVVDGPSTGPAEIRWRFIVQMGGGFETS